jgi:hypothetical protein
MSYDDNYSTDERYDGQRQTEQRNDYDDVDENDYSSAGAPGNYVGDAETLLRRAIVTRSSNSSKSP